MSAPTGNPETARGWWIDGIAPARFDVLGRRDRSHGVSVMMYWLR